MAVIKQRNFIGDILGHGPDGAQEGILVVGRPAGHENGQDGQGAEGKDQQQADVEVPDNQRGRKRYNHKTDQHRQEHDDGGQQIDQLVRIFRSDQLFTD